MTSLQLFNGRRLTLLPACGVLTVLATVMAVGMPDGALAHSGAGACGLHTLRGSYVFTATGYNIFGGVPQPKAILETIEFNGDGTLTVPSATVSVNGNVTRSAGGVGIYTMGAECGGTVTFTPGPSFDIVTDHPGKQAWMIQTNTGAVSQGPVTKVSP